MELFGWAAIKGLLGAQIWKLTTFAAGLGCVVLTGYLIAARVENSHLTHANAVLSDRIDNPKTGYVASMAQCHTNTLTYDAALKMQNAAVEAQSNRDKAALDAANAALAAAQSRIAVLQNRAAAMLDYKPVGADNCARTQDVIAKYVGSLK